MALTPTRVPFVVDGRRQLPLHDGAGSRAIESTAAASLPPNTLMQRAGEALARLAAALAPHASQIWIAAGPGNNGGDGLEAALRLHRAGRRVMLSLLAEPSSLPADAAVALQRAQQAGVRIQAELPATAPGPGQLAIDALLGLGLSRPPEGALAAAVALLNRGAAPVLAADLPSGLDGDSGQPLAAASCVRARWTLSLLTLKPGLFTAGGRDHAGEVWFDGLGVDVAGVAPCAWFGGDDWRGLRLPRRHAQHKGSFGDLWVVGGAPSMGGAVLLAARAALHAGAGRVFLRPLDPAAPPVDALQPELMIRPALPPAAALGALTVVCGCGGGSEVGAELPALLNRAGRLLLDADALNAVAADPALERRLAARASRGLATVLTPHPLEAARLLECDTAAVQRDRLGTAQRLADRLGTVVVLKGSGSVIAAPGELPSINPSGNPALAGPGTGDVLAGWIGGLWSQGLSAADAARLGVYEHGAIADAWAADHGGPTPISASTLISRLAAAAR
ncbi:NAD(P)H-hydrate dehydratase [Rivibacter subsaxonicus]|uniref:Bifunctional NAD(P)H-hydrate repair enzyme n=1 Tax=Rivibacter subsaxonicus TaxID=457575 RepID=A0A4Q7VCQ6_9BURK|nr:NAD(P)H-hydrate dehydratase [Rivibacter subsaxonicus]RZT92528.1 hydroxyethylthiazole kinase-like uncharacterized protein yjeF/hydroxyethylthiazole kinase-like uncharacterized protein yjeF [Rivibacter subsaxonicus]